MTLARYELEPAGGKLHCPQCDGIELRRQGRVGFLQRSILPRFGLFPWECGLCRKVYLLRQRSSSDRKDTQESHPEGHLGPIQLATSRSQH